MTLQEWEELLLEKPNDPYIRWNYGAALGLENRFLEALPYFESRLTGFVPAIRARQRFNNKPYWNGESGKLLVYSDQGIGDFVLWSRYIPDNAIVEVQSEISEIFNTGRYQVYKQGDDLPSFDYVCSIGSLAYIANKIISFPSYIKTNHKRKIKYKWGTVSSGNELFPGNNERSLDEKLYIQYLGNDIVNLSIKTSDNIRNAGIGSWEDTIRAIQNCEKVITVDTAVAHFSGALGKPTVLLLRKNHDWKWGDMEQSVWYPSVKCYRQFEEGDWGGLFQFLNYNDII